MIYLRLFWEFFKTGLLSIGGGLATLPFLRQMGASCGWFTEKELANMLAVSESTPGPIGVNMATYVGFVTAGIPGAIVATLGLVTPSVIIILLIARALKAFRENPYVAKVFLGLRPAATKGWCLTMTKNSSPNLSCSAFRFSLYANCTLCIKSTTSSIYAWYGMLLRTAYWIARLRLMVSTDFEPVDIPPAPSV